MPAAPLISTIIPLYNGADTVERTIASVRAQSLSDIEIVVVNDGSTDAGPAIVDALARSDARITLVHRPNGGLPCARNTGLDHARGTYIHFLDADDTIDPRAYEVLTRADTHATGAVVCGHHVRTMSGQLIDTNIPNRAVVTVDDLVDRIGFVCHAPLLRRAAIGSLRFSESFRSYEDLDFWFRLGETGVRWVVVNEPLVTYTMRPGSMSKDLTVMLAAAHDALANLFDRQRALPESQRCIDASPDRLGLRLRHFALAYATQTAIQKGATGPDEGIDLFASARGDKRITPEEAAEKARHAFTYALARPIHDDLDQETDALRALNEFWSGCAARGWADSHLPVDALIHLRRIQHEHAMVAAEILDRLAGDGALTIIGYGCNGSVLADLGLERGLRITIRDDRFTDPLRAPVPQGTLAESMDAPLRSGEPVVISPLGDDALAARFAGCDRVIRWRDVRREIFAPRRLLAS